MTLTRPALLDALLGLAVAGALVALAFLTSASADQTVTAGGTWSEIALTLLGAGGCGAAVLRRRSRWRWGLATIGLFAALVALQALSILWSVQPDWSWFGADQTLSYLAVFAGAAALAGLVPGRWPALLGGIAAGLTALSAYALLAKVFPATLAASNTYGRLQAPFGYWNAVGAVAAMGLPLCLWAGSRRTRAVMLRALCVPALSVQISVIVLSYSRSSLAAGAVGIAGVLAFVPVRLRATLVLAVAGLGAIPIVAWALGNASISADKVPLAAQDSAGHTFGLVLAVTLIIVLAAGVGTIMASDRLTPSAALRRRVGAILLGGVALVPVAAVAALAASSRGLTGQISHAWHSLTNPSGGVSDTSSRIGQLGSSRPLYWHQGIEVGIHHLLAGAGELGYGVARLRFSTAPKADQAHSYLVQTFADLGLLGLAVTFALLAAWVIAAARPVAPHARWRALPAELVAEREGMVAAAMLVVSFGVLSAVDYTWYFPGVTVAALLCAGWLAGRGPLVATPAVPGSAGSRGSAGSAGSAGPAGSAGSAPTRGRSLLDRPGAAALLTALAGVTVIGAWLMWQPLRSAQQLSASEATSSNPRAFADARAAASSDPLALEPLYRLAYLYEGIGDRQAARREFVSAAQLQPDNPDPWYQLGSYDLQTGRPRLALTELSRVVALDSTPDVTSFAPRALIAQARATLASRQNTTGSAGRN